MEEDTTTAAASSIGPAKIEIQNILTTEVFYSAIRQGISSDRILQLIEIHPALLLSTKYEFYWKPKDKSRQDNLLTIFLWHNLGERKCNRLLAVATNTTQTQTQTSTTAASAAAADNNNNNNNNTTNQRAQRRTWELDPDEDTTPTSPIVTLLKATVKSCAAMLLLAKGTLPGNLRHSSVEWLIRKCSMNRVNWNQLSQAKEQHQSAATAIQQEKAIIEMAQTHYSMKAPLPATAREAKRRIVLIFNEDPFYHAATRVQTAQHIIRLLTKFPTLIKDKFPFFWLPREKRARAGTCFTIFLWNNLGEEIWNNCYRLYDLTTTSNNAGGGGRRSALLTTMKGLSNLLQTDNYTLQEPAFLWLIQQCQSYNEEISDGQEEMVVDPSPLINALLRNRDGLRKPIKPILEPYAMQTIFQLQPPPSLDYEILFKEFASSISVSESTTASASASASTSASANSGTGGTGGTGGAGTGQGAARAGQQSTTSTTTTTNNKSDSNVGLLFGGSSGSCTGLDLLECIAKRNPLASRTLKLIASSSTSQSRREREGATTGEFTFGKRWAGITTLLLPQLTSLEICPTQWTEEGFIAFLQSIINADSNGANGTAGCLERLKIKINLNWVSQVSDNNEATKQLQEFFTLLPSKAPKLRTIELIGSSHMPSPPPNSTVQQRREHYRRFSPSISASNSDGKIKKDSAYQAILNGLAIASGIDIRVENDDDDDETATESATAAATTATVNETKTTVTVKEGDGGGNEDNNNNNNGDAPTTSTTKEAPETPPPAAAAAKAPSSPTTTSKMKEATTTTTTTPSPAEAATTTAIIARPPLDTLHMSQFNQVPATFVMQLGQFVRELHLKRNRLCSCTPTTTTTTTTRNNMNNANANANNNANNPNANANADPRRVPPPNAGDVPFRRVARARRPFQLRPNNNNDDEDDDDDDDDDLREEMMANLLLLHNNDHPPAGANANAGAGAAAANANANANVMEAAIDRLERRHDEMMRRMIMALPPPHHPHRPHQGGGGGPDRDFIAFHERLRERRRRRINNANANANNNAATNATTGRTSTTSATTTTASTPSDPLVTKTRAWKDLANHFDVIAKYSHKDHNNDDQKNEEEKHQQQQQRKEGLLVSLTLTADPCAGYFDTDVTQGMIDLICDQYLLEDLHVTGRFTHGRYGSRHSHRLRVAPFCDALRVHPSLKRVSILGVRMCHHEHLDATSRKAIPSLFLDAVLQRAKTARAAEAMALLPPPPPPPPTSSKDGAKAAVTPGLPETPPPPPPPMMMDQLDVFDGKEFFAWDQIPYLKDDNFVDYRTAMEIWSAIVVGRYHSHQKLGELLQSIADLPQLCRCPDGKKEQNDANLLTAVNKLGVSKTEDEISGKVPWIQGKLTETSVLDPFISPVYELLLASPDLWCVKSTSTGGCPQFWQQQQQCCHC